MDNHALCTAVWNSMRHRATVAAWTVYVHWQVHSGSCDHMPPAVSLGAPPITTLRSLLLACHAGCFCSFCTHVTATCSSMDMQINGSVLL
jgi:hypothetical protein